MPTTTTTTTTAPKTKTKENCDTPMASEEVAAASATTTPSAAAEDQGTTTPTTKPTTTPTPTLLPLLASAAACNKQLLFCRRFKDQAVESGSSGGGVGGFLRNFNSLPLFVYATSSSTHASSADGVGVAKEAAAFIQKNEGFELPATHGLSKTDGSSHGHRQLSNGGNTIIHSSTHNGGIGGHLRTTELAMECLPLNSSGAHPHHLMANSVANGTSVATAASPTTTVVVGATYPHHLHHHHHMSHHAPYSNSYGSHITNHNHHIHSEQTKSLQELQHEVGALLEFRDLVIETFPDLKNKMASMSATPSTPTSSVGHSSVGAGVGSTVGGGGVGGSGGSSSLATRREWEPGIRMKRKLSHKEPSTTSASGSSAAVTTTSGNEQSSSSSLTRSRSNSHSGKKEPKSGENNNGSVIQDSGFSTETSSSKDGHSASSTNGAITVVAIASNRLSCAESDDELLNLLDVIHRKSNRLRDEVEHLQSYERRQIDSSKCVVDGKSVAGDGMTPQQFREQVERLNREDIKQLRKERDKLLDKLAEMEAETFTGRIKASKMNEQVEELISVKKDLEEQLKLAMAQKLELSSRVQQLQQQQQGSKSSSSVSQSDYSSSQQRNFLSSATTVLSNGSRPSYQNTFQPVVLDQPSHQQDAFHQSTGSDITTSATTTTTTTTRKQQQPLGRLDGIVSTPGARNTKCRITDSKRFSAILLETNVLELQRHLLTLTVQNQVLAQKLDSSSKSKTVLAKQLNKNQEDYEHMRYQLEEKTIELEGTKAQLRLVESRLQGSNSTTNSYLNSSQHDYETNRSSASTTLMLSRRGVPDSVDTSTTIATAAMPAPTTTQISTPSMKAMVPLAMDELQQHSSSTESAHENETIPMGQSTPNTPLLNTTMINGKPLGTSTPSSIAARVMSTSVGGVSPFDQTPTARQHAFRKFGSASKPSKIPLPGSKAAAYFAGKPPTGRPSTDVGRSPPSVHNSNSTSYGSKSTSSHSTGNLQSLRRADSASNHSLSTNTSRSSTSSSIPLATTPYSSGNRSQMAVTNPSPRVLQNSPLPKLKRETLSSRVRHLDSLSRSQQSPLSESGRNNSASSIAAQLSTSVRKDLQLNNNASSTVYHHRRSGHSSSAFMGSNASVSERAPLGIARRLSSASAPGSTNRMSREQQQQQQQQHQHQHQHHGEALVTTTPVSSFGGGGGDSDSGKNLTNSMNKPNFRFNNKNWQLWQTATTATTTATTAYPRDFKIGLEPTLELSEETAYDSYYTQYTVPDSMECVSNNLLVTFDYGYSDSIDATDHRQTVNNPIVAIAPVAVDDLGDGDDTDGAIWFGTPPNDAKPFEVHHVQHKLFDGSLQSLISYDVDDFEDELSDQSEQDQELDEEIFYDSIEC